MENLTGQKFGRWEVLSFERTEKRTCESRSYYCIHYWKVRCDCGTIKIIRESCLRQGNTQSCGCLRLDLLRENRIGSGEAAFNSIFRHYKKEAQRKHLRFDLLKEEFKEMTKECCHYCKMPPFQIIRGKLDYGDYIYTGIDRIDSNAGYIKENCVPCCKFCNWAKNSRTQEEFKNWIILVYNNYVNHGQSAKN